MTYAYTLNPAPPTPWKRRATPLPKDANMTRPTDAEIVKVLREMTDRFHANMVIDDGEYYSASELTVEEETDMVNEAYAIADALEAASVEPSPLAHITTIGQLFEVIDYDFDGSGLTVTDGNLLANTIANTFPALTNDMPHLVTTDNDSYTVSGVDYTFTEVC